MAHPVSQQQFGSNFRKTRNYCRPIFFLYFNLRGKNIKFHHCSNIRREKCQKGMIFIKSCFFVRAFLCEDLPTSSWWPNSSRWHFVLVLFSPQVILKIWKFKLCISPDLENRLWGHFVISAYLHTNQNAKIFWKFHSARFQRAQINLTVCSFLMEIVSYPSTIAWL